MRKERDISSPPLSLSKYSIFPSPTQPVVFVMAEFLLIEDADTRGGRQQGASQMFLWLFVRSGILMLPANARAGYLHREDDSVDWRRQC